MVDMDDRGSLREDEPDSPAASKIGRAASEPRNRPQPQDTAECCKSMAAADMARAALEAAGWARVRYEHSAVMWSRRAEWLAAAETPARRG